jgi:HlyD family secretion protein
MIKRNWKRIVLVVGLVVVAVGGYVGYQMMTGRNQRTAAFTNVQIEPAQLGDLEATVGATGKVRANQSAILSWETTGTVGSVAVSLGQVVKKDDVLAELEQTSLPEIVILAQADLLDAQQALDDLLNSHLAQADALIALEDAQQAVGDLDNYDVDRSGAEKAVVDAQEAVDKAQRDVYISQSTAGQADIDAAYLQTLMADNALEAAKKAYEPYENRPLTSVTRARFQAELSAAQKSYDDAVRNYHALTSTADKQGQAVAEAELAAAGAQLAESQRELDRIQNGRTPGDAARLQAQLEDAQRKWERVKDGPDPSEIAAAEANVAAAQATLNQAKIIAPFDGTITASDARPGDDITEGLTAFRVDDVTRLFVDIQVSEIDISKIQVDQPARLTFDALPDQVYAGKVVEVGRIGVDDSGIAKFDVTVEVSEPDEAILTGMTATVEIIAMQLKAVLLVPNQSIRVEDGKQVVYVMRAQAGMQPVEIKLGASSDAYSQVVSGDLKEGDRVVLNPASLTQSGDQGPGGFFMMRRVTGGGGGGPDEQPGGGPPPGGNQP